MFVTRPAVAGSRIRFGGGIPAPYAGATRRPGSGRPANNRWTRDTTVLLESPAWLPNR